MGISIAIFIVAFIAVSPHLIDAIYALRLKKRKDASPDPKE